MVFSEDMCSSDYSQSTDSQISVKEELDSEAELSSNGPTSPDPCLDPTPPPAHSNDCSRRSHHHLRRHSRQQTVTAGAGLVVGADPDTVILVSRDKRTGRREHILLRSLLKTRGGAASGGRVEKRVVVNRG